ncbi:hypothetical protein GCM10010967_47350 [Dyadobacter beijingensis]|uniref:HTH cro/C1-type domain-containing protein n=1 Tax=Dyadobacter beijingensis TaxID=365489 RepID=A0ABQ2IEQ3_9BACT|nr:helix-turn-helix transcriptional regulator [Dyadobacter beijingensis]GGN06623.1 hypothetical protein GCM10010967_47350 [Dyadobacter beijingensis]
MNIGTLLRKFRDTHRISSRYVAERIGVSHSTYLDWEHDKSSPSIRNFTRLAAALELDPVDLMSYLSGKSCTVNTTRDLSTISDLKEMVKYYQQYTHHLEKGKSLAELELSRLKEAQRPVSAV